MNEIQSTVDVYIASQPEAVQPVLQNVRTIIRSVIPGAPEVIAWGMPSYKGKPYIIHFAAHKSHLGLYPGAEAMVHFQDRLRDFHTSKGAIQFPYSAPVPKELIADIVRFCASQNG
jgi:uncharacterized protein YdhG (YjbR/CyaY superfamily)